MSNTAGSQTRTGIIVVIGATATGKTSLAIELAHLFDGEIVNADSRLFYRGMDIGTAKPTESERQGIRHHLIDILHPADSYSLSDFLQHANAAIEAIDARGKIPIIVGGSGQYIWGLLEGWIVPKIAPNPTLRAALELQLSEHGLEALQHRLRETGAINIDRVEMLNARRVIRAIERAVATGDALGGAGRSVSPPYDTIIIGLTAPREILHQRVESRLKDMMASGWRDEVKALMNAGVSRDTASMSAIGYRQMIDYIEGRTTEAEMYQDTQIGNHRLIGAQHNWFKPRDERITWFDVTHEDFTAAVTSAVRRWLQDRESTTQSG